MNRVVGVDYGTKRVGLAISDGLGLTARPLEVVPRRDVLERLIVLRGEYEFDTVVVGLPTGLSGGEGSSATGARRLGDEISESLEVEVVFVDERFTSRMAEGVLLEAGMKRAKRKETVDRVAAAIILQTYLDRRSIGNLDEPGYVEPPDTNDI